MMLRKFETEARKALGPLPDKTSIPKVGCMCAVVLQPYSTVVMVAMTIRPDIASRCIMQQ